MLDAVFVVPVNLPTAFRIASRVTYPCHLLGRVQADAVAVVEPDKERLGHSRVAGGLAAGQIVERLRAATRLTTMVGMGTLIWTLKPLPVLLNCWKEEDQLSMLRSFGVASTM